MGASKEENTEDIPDQGGTEKNKNDSGAAQSCSCLLKLVAQGVECL